MAINILTNPVPVGKITCASAFVGGNITDTDGKNVLERGIVYAKTSKPDLAKNLGRIKLGTIKGSFQTMLNGLDQDTTYYVRAYAVFAGSPVLNWYGPEVSFHTNQAVVIGNLVWMMSNLNIDVFNDGSPIAQATNSDDMLNKCNNGVAGYCYFNIDASNLAFTKYGKLYNRAAMSNQNLVPTGWRIPSLSDWNSLETTAISNGGASNLICNLKKCSEWPPTGGIDFNATQFSALPGGQFNNGFFWGAYAKGYGDQCEGNWWISDLSIYKIDTSNTTLSKVFSKDTASYCASIRICKNL